VTKSALEVCIHDDALYKLTTFTFTFTFSCVAFVDIVLLFLPVSIVAALVLTKLDFGNATLAGTPSFQLDRLQAVMNATA